MIKRILTTSTAVIALSLGGGAVNADILDDNAAEVQVGVNIQVPRSVEVVQDIEFGTLLVDSANMTGPETFYLGVLSLMYDNSTTAPNVESRGGEQEGLVCTSITEAEYELASDHKISGGLGQLNRQYGISIAEESVTLTSETDGELTFIPDHGGGMPMLQAEGYGFCWVIAGGLTIPQGVAAGRYEGAINVNVIYGEDGVESMEGQANTPGGSVMDLLG